MRSAFTIQRKIARLNDLLDRATARMERAFGHSTHCVMGNDHEHTRWGRVKLNEPELADQDDAGRVLLPTWPDLTADLYSAMRRTATVLYDEDQIAPTHRGNLKLLAPLVQSDEWDHIHDMTMGDDNMSVIAALKIQDGWITELKRQKEEAEQRRQEQQQRAQERREEREKQQQEEEQQDDDGGDGQDSAGGGDHQDEDGDDGGTGQEEGSSDGVGDDLGGDAGTGEDADLGGDSASEPVGEAEKAGGSGGTEEGELDGPGGAAAGSGPGVDQEGVGSTEGLPDAAYSPAPEPNNAVEAAEAGAAHASALQAARLALEEAERLAEACEGEEVEEALAAAEVALEAAEGLTEASEDTVERVLAQRAFDEENPSNAAGDALKRALKLAAADLKDQEETLRAWGVGKADLKEMSPTEVMDLFKLLRDSQELKKIADLIGYQRREVQKRKVRDRYAHGPEVRIGVEQGDALNKMVSSQRLQARLTPNVFRYRYLNHQLIQHRTRIQEVQERGDGWLLVDASGSMYYYGEPYTYNQIARATAITVVEYFQQEGRNCIISLFDGGVRETINVPAGLSRAELLRFKLKIAQDGYGGGTDFYDPLRAALTGIQNGVEFWDKSSVVMITDGQCYMSEAQCQEIKQLQDETKVDVQTWLMPGGKADQMTQFGPVDSVQTSLQEAGAMALKMVERMDAQWQ